MNRRTFLKRALGGCAACGLTSLFSPRLAFAQAPGCGKNFIFLKLDGGLDGLFAFPYIASAINGTINDLRGPLAVTAGSIAVTSDIGMHAKCLPLHSELAGQDYKLITMVGMTGSDERSHDLATKQLEVLSTDVITASSGWIGRLKEVGRAQGCYGPYSAFGLHSDGITYDPPGEYPALKMHSLSNFDYRLGAFSSNEDAALRAAEQQLLNLTLDRSSIEQSIVNVAKGVQPTVNVVRGMRNVNPVGTYGPSSGSSLKDAARICIDAKNNRPGTDTVIQINLGGFDNHGRLLEVLPALIDDLANSLAGLAQDLKASGLWNNTVIALGTEFGRSIQVKEADPEKAGTEHGRATTLMVMGGQINGGGSNSHYGPIPTVSELIHARNVLIPTVDIRNIFSEIITWLGYNPSGVITDHNYAVQNIRLFG